MDIIEWLIAKLGYATVVKLKDVVLFASGIAVGECIMLMLVGYFFNRIQQVEELGKVTSVRFKHEGRTYYFAQIKNFFQAVEFLTTVIYMPFLRKGDYTLEDKKRTRLFAVFVCISMVCVILLGALLITHPIVDMQYIPPDWK